MSGLFNLKSNRDAKAKFDAINETQATIEFFPDGTIIDANDHFLNAMGYRLDEIKGQHHRMFMDPNEANTAEYQQFWRELAEGQFKSADMRRKTNGNRDIWIQATYSPVRDERGKIVKILKVASDITEIVKARQASMAKLEALDRVSAVIEFETDGTIRRANENFLNAMGYTAEEIIGQHHRMFVDPAFEHSSEYANFWKELAAGNFKVAEFERVAKGGRKIWIQASYNPIFAADGTVDGVIKFATDVTEQVTKRQHDLEAAGLIKNAFSQIVDQIETAHQQTEQVVSETNQTSDTIQAVAASTEEFSASIGEISQNMTRSTAAVEQVVQEINETDQATQALVTSAEAMNSILSMIDDIAGQINLLALNATIESARAGEAGKGFAVVASEVKNLAGQVANATSQISEEISGIQAISGDVVRRLEQIQSAVATVDQNVSGVASAVEEQSAMTSDIAHNTRAASDAAERTNSGMRDAVSAMEAANKFASEGLAMIESNKIA